MRGARNAMPSSPAPSPRGAIAARAAWPLLLACAIRPSFPLSSTPRTTIRAEAPRSPGSAFDPAAPTRPVVAPGRPSADEWASAKRSLRNPKCCVVSVPGLERHLSVLRESFCGDEAPSDLDLRMRVRCGMNDDGRDMTREDCATIYDAVVGPSSSAKADDPADASRALGIAALEELARGTSSLADGPLEGGACDGVHVRIAIASDYRAVDPSWHTDKCPLRGYVALTGPGTELASVPCRPWEYAALRAWGSGGLEAFGRGGGGAGAARVGLRSAGESEFIVMKGDYYQAPLPGDASPSAADALIRKVWNRSSACVHRSPPSASSGNSSGGSKGDRRRVILSLDLADGRDDQEWYEVSRKRGWRSGMTQRKSRLVS